MKSKAMKTIEIKLFKFNELSEEAQQKALGNLWDINEDHEWWSFIYNHAETVYLKISGFNIDRRCFCELSFKHQAKDTAEEILKNHGKNTDTYKLSKVFLKKFEEAGELEANDKSKELEDKFLEDLANEYLSMLRNEYEYLESEEAIKETIIAKDYDFTENGELY